jgi:hypothetical protein
MELLAQTHECEYNVDRSPASRLAYTGPDSRIPGIGITGGGL